MLAFCVRMRVVAARSEAEPAVGGVARLALHGDAPVRLRILERRAARAHNVVQVGVQRLVILGNLLRRAHS